MTNTNTMTFNIKGAAKGCRVEIYTDSRGKPCASFWTSNRQTNRNGYYYLSTNLRRAAVKAWVRDQIKRAERRAQSRVDASKPHNVKVGDVFSASWGYDQTNIDYVEVTKLVGKTMVEVREIAQHASFDAIDRGECAPDVGNYKSEPMRKRIKMYGESPSFNDGVRYFSRETPSHEVNGAKVYSGRSWTAYH